MIQRLRYPFVQHIQEKTLLIAGPNREGEYDMIDDECYDTIPNPEDHAEYIYPDGVYTLQTQTTDMFSDRTACIRVEENSRPVANNDSQGIYVENPETVYP